MRKALVFGVFDLLHPGHLHFFRQARKHGRFLIVVAAPDEDVLLSKGERSHHNERQRMKAVRASGLADKVVLGDKKRGEFRVIKKYKPDIVCLGYDQEKLKQHLLAKKKELALPDFKIVKLKPFHPKKFKTSVIKSRVVLPNRRKLV